jgi:hypothetical protein
VNVVFLLEGWFLPNTLNPTYGLHWRLQENLDPADIEARYFASRSDDYHAFERMHFARANFSRSLRQLG